MKKCLFFLHRKYLIMCCVDGDVGGKPIGVQRLFSYLSTHSVTPVPDRKSLDAHLLPVAPYTHVLCVYHNEYFDKEILYASP